MSREHIPSRAIDTIAALGEGLPSGRRDISGGKPGGELHRPAFAHLREGVAVPLAEGALGDPGLDVDGRTRGLRDALGRLHGAEQG